MRSLTFVDAVVGKMTSDSVAIWEQLRFDVIYKGGDWADDERGVALEKTFAYLPVEIVYFPYTRNTSSDRLRSVLDA